MEYNLEEDRNIAFGAWGTDCMRCGKHQTTEEAVIHPRDGEHGPRIARSEDLMVLCPKCHSKLHNEINSLQEGFTGLKEFEEAGYLILKGIEKMGMELDHDNFKDTPKRLARAYYEIFNGCSNLEERVQSILSTSFPSSCNSMVVEKNIRVFSMCPHHLLPVEYVVCVGYIPKEDGKVLGISKLTRLVELLAKRPALQEDFSRDITKHLMQLGLEGAAACVEGQHMCMRMRGVKMPSSSVITMSVEGLFKEDVKCRNEFMSHISDRDKLSK